MRRPNETSKSKFSRELLATAAALTVSVCGIGGAYAQNPPDAEEEEAIVVTGSRAARSGYQAPSPTNVIGAEVLDNQAATGIGEILEQTGMIKGTRNPNSNATNTGSPGQWTADLRGLGGQRSLVLVDSSRIVPFAPASNLSVPTTTDLNLIPTLMIDRVETVTGGASAQYGSDAVSGVVNIFLRREYDGFRVRAQTGVSQEGDANEYRLGVLGGWNSEDDRAHLVLSADYVDSDGVRDIYTRDWGQREVMIVATPGGATSLTWADGVHAALGDGGIINRGRNAANTAFVNFSLTGQTFNPDGTIRPFDFGYPAAPGGTTSTMIGGEGQSIAKGVDLVPAVERFAAYGRFGYDFSPDLYGYVSLGYSESSADLTATQPRLTSTQILIRADNAFLPAVVANAMAAESVPAFRMTRLGNDLGNNQYNIQNKSPRFSAGLEGALANGWDWDAHVSYGRNEYTFDSMNNPISANLAFALDAVDDGAGNIVCRATLPGPSFDAAAAGCQPLNLFGEGNASPEAINYIQGDPNAEVTYDQATFGANLRGELFATWAGPIAAATGFEYRDESEEVTSDPIAAAGGYLSGNNSPYSGDFNVSEGYVEAIVPLARDVSFARLIDLNLAYRYADYSTVGGMEAWKIGAVWEPTEDLRFRVTQSHDIRAPAINELYSPGNFVTNNITMININDFGLASPPVRNYNIPQRTSGGNSSVKAEEGDTTTIGFVYSPVSGPLEGFSISLDYYDILLDNAITNLSGANIGNLCIGGVQQFCDVFTYNAAGDPISLDAGSLNLGSFEQSGYDLQIDYSRELGPGTWSVSYTGTYVDESIVDTGIPGIAPIDRAGEHGAANFAAVPTFRGNLTTTFRTDLWSGTAQVTHVSSGNLDNTYNTGGTTINKNDIPAYALLNLYGSYNLTERIRLFGAIRNALDTDPVMTPYTVLNAPVYGAYYDKVGRFFSIGVDVNF